jgi:hypothetical protein
MAGFPEQPSQPLHHLFTTANHVRQIAGGNSRRQSYDGSDGRLERFSLEFLQDPVDRRSRRAKQRDGSLDSLGCLALIPGKEKQAKRTRNDGGD